MDDIDIDDDAPPTSDEQAHLEPVPAEAAESSSPYEYDHTQEVRRLLSHWLQLSASRRFPVQDADLRHDDHDGYIVVMEWNVHNGGFSGVAASEEAIAVLPATTVQGGGEVVMGEKECPVCLEAYEAGDTVRTLPCSHGFHEGCIFRWLRVSRLCPLCRFEMPAAS